MNTLNVVYTTGNNAPDTVLATDAETGEVAVQPTEVLVKLGDTLPVAKVTRQWDAPVVIETPEQYMELVDLIPLLANTRQSLGIWYPKAGKDAWGDPTLEYHWRDLACLWAYEGDKTGHYYLRAYDVKAPRTRGKDGKWLFGDYRNYDLTLVQGYRFGVSYPPAGQKAMISWGLNNTIEVILSNDGRVTVYPIQWAKRNTQFPPRVAPKSLPGFLATGFWSVTPPAEVLRRNQVVATIS
jgi:hypothetical protein